MPDQLATTMPPPGTPAGEPVGRPGPPLSATSDMPRDPPAAPPFSAEVNTHGDKPLDDGSVSRETKPASQDAPETPEEAPTGTEGEGEGGEGEGETAAKPKKGISERFSEISAARRAAEDQARQLSASLAAATAAIERLTKAPAEQSTEAATDPRPKREVFDDPDKYDQALVEWSARQTTRVVTAETEAKRLKDAETAQLTTLQADWSKKRNAAIAEFPDYVAVAEGDHVTITVPMAHTILHADQGPRIAYHLGQHPDEATRIANLNPVQQAYELGKLAQRLTPRAQTTRAPRPITAIGSNAGATPRTLEEVGATGSMEEYAAMRNPQLLAARRGGFMAKSS